MRYLKFLVVLLFAAVLVLPFTYTSSVEGQAVVDAPATDMDARTPDLFNNNGTVAEFEEAQIEFAGVEEIADGVGPVYNAQSCRECHQSPDTGAAAQTSEFRAGHLVGNTFVEAPGGSLINDRAIDSDIQERVSSNDPVRTFRMSISTLGDGFVEALANTTLQNNVAAQPAGQRGTLINVDVFEAPGQTRIGRFGWKDQQASLLSFSADAYVNEMGITSNFPQTDHENTSNGVSVAAFDNCGAGCVDPEDDTNEDIGLFATFMRGLRVPGRGPINAQVNAGESLFLALDCDICHTPTFVTAAPGTLINGGAATVSTALGNKRIHPYSDFALHDVGTGDGIVQNGGQGTRNQVRTAALWGVRARVRLMHDGESLTVNDAILRHGGQALTIRNNYNNLSTASKQAVIAFVLSL
ncbi:MAG TPA: di-heme oxidoredictase family protein [Blastocatellia bacterium]|nr:di-heme oxidoredictase family protein [Blastocatellia bacterium]